MINHYEKLSAKRIEPMVAKWILHYLTIFKPVQDGIISSVGDYCNNEIFAARQRHLFCSATGEMSAEQYGNVIKEHFSKYCLVDLGLASWRHSFTALAEEHIRADDPDQPEELRSENTVANDQMGHSNATSENHYGRSSKRSTAGNAYMALVDVFGDQWQCFILGKIKKDLNFKKNDSVGMVTMRDNNVGDSLATSHHTTNITYNVNIVAAPSASVDGSVFSKLHGTPGISNWCEQRLRMIYQAIAKRKLHSKPFRYEGTKKCFDTIFSSSLGDYICVLPTGSGKSTIFQYLAISDLGQMQDIMIVIIPLKELLENQIHISTQMQLPFIRYDAEKPTTTMIGEMFLDGLVEKTKRIVFVQVEHLGCRFLEFINYLNACNRLCKLVFDEFHLYMIHQHIRSNAFRNNQDVIQAVGNVGRVFLSATVEMRREKELIDVVSLGIGNGRIAPTVIRHGKIPSNIGFVVTTFNTTDQCLLQLGLNLKRLSANNTAKARYIVFVLTVDDMERVAANLQINHHLSVTTMHSRMLEDRKDDSRMSWFNGTKSIMVATVSFSHGVDYEDVPYIVIYRGMYDLTTMLQCAGRGGRGEGTQTILEVMAIEEEYKTPSSHCQKICNTDFCSWVTVEKRCRRNILSHAFYGCTEICTFEDLPCDYCLCHDPTMWNKDPSSKALDFICNDTTNDANVQQNIPAFIDNPLDRLEDDWFDYVDKQNSGGSTSIQSVTANQDCIVSGNDRCGNGNYGDLGIGSSEVNNNNINLCSYGQEREITTHAGVFDTGFGTVGSQNRRMHTMTKMPFNSTTSAMVTQSSPNSYKLLREEEIHDNNGNKKLKSHHVPDFCSLPLSVDAGRVSFPIPNMNDNRVRGSSIPFINPRYATGSEQVFLNPQKTYAVDEEYMIGMLPKNSCGICFGQTLQPFLQDHGFLPGGTMPAPCLYAAGRNCCFNCISREHFANKCPIKNCRNIPGYCNRCMISIAIHKGNGYGNKCCLQTADFTWNAAWSVYRNNRSVFLECVSIVSNETGILLSDDTSVCKWLISAVTTKPCALNVTRLVVALLKRQQVNTTKNNLGLNG